MWPSGGGKRGPGCTYERRGGEGWLSGTDTTRARRRWATVGVALSLGQGRLMGGVWVTGPASMGRSK
jgi:hypothetical protein